MPRSAAKPATPIAANGRIARTRTLLRTVSARLFVQRSALRCCKARRGAASSHAAIIAKIAEEGAEPYRHLVTQEKGIHNRKVPLRGLVEMPETDYSIQR